MKFGFYALTQALVSLAMVAMLRHMVKRHQVSGLPDRFATETAWDSYGLLAASRCRSRYSSSSGTGGCSGSSSRGWWGGFTGSATGETTIPGSPRTRGAVRLLADVSPAGLTDVTITALTRSALAGETRGRS